MNNLNQNLLDADSLCGTLDRQFVTLEEILADYDFERVYALALGKCLTCKATRTQKYSLVKKEKGHIAHWEVCGKHLNCLKKQHALHLPLIDEPVSEFDDMAFETSTRDLYYKDQSANTHSWRTCTDETHEHCLEYKFEAEKKEARSHAIDHTAKPTYNKPGLRSLIISLVRQEQAQGPA